MSADTATLERQLQLYKGLVEVSGLINALTESTALLPAVLEVARRVFGTEAASLFLLGEGGDLVLVASHGGPKDFLGRLTVPRGRGFAGWVAEHSQPLLVPDAYLDPRFFSDFDRDTGFRTRSMLCAPLQYEGRTTGVLQVINPVGEEPFSPGDLEAFAAYATLAATAIEKVDLLERERSQRQAAQEAAWAREIQTSFLPQTLPERADLHFASIYRPALNVGGDFYDVLETGPDEIYFAIGDVSGKGVPGALLMAQAVSILRSIIQPGISPAAALTRWNSLLSGHTVRGMFITALLGRILVSERRIELANAGHCAPFRISAADGAREVLQAGSLPLGIRPELGTPGYEVTLEEGEWIVFYTDGLVESFNPQDEQLERAGVAALLRRPFAGAAEIVETLRLGEQHHRGLAEPADDLTILAFGFQ